MKKGRHSRREMDLSNQTDLNFGLTEFAGSIVGIKTVIILVQAFCYPE